jgi:hypothetical protein
VAEAIARSARELVETSKLQERLAARLGDAGGARNEALIREQLVVKGAVDRITANLHEAGRKTLALSPMVYIQLGLARRHVDEALAGLDDGRASRASDASAQALLAINLAAIELLRSSSSMGGKGSGDGRQAMQQLLQQQLSLREQIMEMLQRGSEGRWSMEERAGMARLAAEQRSMEEIMERIAEESRGANELMGTLDDLAGRMGISRSASRRAGSTGSSSTARSRSSRGCSTPSGRCASATTSASAQARRPRTSRRSLPTGGCPRPRSASSCSG